VLFFFTCCKTQSPPVVNCAPSVPGDGTALQDNRPVLSGVDVMKYWDYNLSGAFHTNDGAQYGLSAYAYNFRGFQFWFSDAATRDRFRQNPAQYSPNLGGFGALGISTELGPTAVPPGTWPWSDKYLGPPVDVNQGWSIINGKLFLTVRQSFRTQLEQNYLTVLPTAFSHWLLWFGDTNAGPFNTHCLTYGDFPNLCVEKIWPESWGWSPGGVRSGQGPICINGLINSDPITSPPVDPLAGPVNSDGLNRREVGLIVGLTFAMFLIIGLSTVLVLIAKKPDVLRVS